MYMPHFVHSPVGGHLGCFHPLVNNAALHVNIQYLVESPVSICLSLYLEEALLDHTVI